VGAAVAFLSLSARSQSLPSEPPQNDAFGQKGECAISGERLFGLVHSIRVENSSTKTLESLGLFTSPDTEVVAAYAAPRVAFDCFAATRFSLGIALGFQAVGNADALLNTVVLAPRVGYAAAFSQRVGIWPRVGVTYQSTSLGDGQGTHLFALTLEAPLVFTPVPHAALTIGPTLDLGLAGSKPGAINFRETDIGLQAGLLIYL
jgi:hypothetical protein